MNQQLLKKCMICALVSSCVLAASGCTVGSRRVQSSDYPFDFTLDCILDGRHVLLFIIDGCRADLLQEMAEAGELPAIKKYFIDRGVVAGPAVAPVPSITNASIAAITCGAYPGHLNVVGNRWFDHEMLRRASVFSVREYYLANEYLARKTIFEMLPDEPTATVGTPCVRGSTFNVHLHYNLVGAMNYLFGRWDKVDEIFVEEFRDVAGFANKEGLFPRVTYFHLSGLDFTAHRYGPFSPEAKSILKNVDAALGDLMRGLERNAALEKICLILVADHGHVPLKKENYVLMARLFSDRLCLSSLECYGAVDRSESPLMREMHYEKFAVISSNNGRNAFLHFRHNPAGTWIPPEEMASWEARPEWEELRHYPTPRGMVDIVEELRRVEGIGFIIGRPRDGEVAVFSAKGEGRIRTKISDGEASFLYEVVSGDDPLGYRESAAGRLMDGQYHSSREWLRATCTLPQTDVVAQLPSLFESPCCGDLFIVAADEWDFEEPNVSSHGGFLRSEMTVPLLVAGPGVRTGRFGPVRVVDIVPTILDYLGYGDKIGQYGLDGVSFWKEIEATNSRASFKHRP